MRPLLKTILSLCVTVAFLTGAYAQQSDYEIKEEYKATYADIEKALAEAPDVATVDSLIEEIDELEENYRAHDEIIDNALYPESLESSLEKLRSNARNTQHRLLVIENQSEKLKELNREVSSFESEITKLNERTDSLRQEILNSQQSEKRLSGLVQQYRKSLQQRDHFILDVVDSLLIAYRDMSPKAMNELTDKMESGKISDDQNPLVIIQTIIDENIETLKASKKSFTTEDYLRIYAVQRRFSEAWNQIGDGLIRIYGGDNRANWVTTIDSKLEDWRASASLNMWTSLDNYLESHELDMAAFDNNYSFYVALDNFVKEAKKTSEEQIITSENYEKYKKFNDFWNSKIKDDWSKFVQDGEVLTMSQISSIDSEMTNWRDESKPMSLFLPIMLGVSLLIIIGLIVYLIFR